MYIERIKCEARPEFDFSRDEQSRLLREAEAASPGITRGRRPASPALLNGVLRAVDDHRWDRKGYLCEEMLAREVNCSIRQFRRALIILVEDYGILTTGRPESGFHEEAQTI